METVKNQCLNLNVKRDHAVDEPIIPSKTKYTKIRQYNPKKPCKWGFKNIVRAGKSGFMYDFYLYCGKEDRPPADYDHLSGSAQSVAWLCSNLQRHAGKYVFFNNWFTNLDLLLYLKNIGLQAVYTIRGNRLQGCPLIPVKYFKEQKRGAVDSRVDNSSGLVIVRWLENIVVQLAPNFVGVEPMVQIDCLCKKTKALKAVSCPKNVSMYNANMGGVDLVGMLISLYRKDVKTRRWCIKVF